MNNYDEFEDQQKALEEESDTKHELLGILFNWTFLSVGVAITAAATHFLTNRGMHNATIYKQFLGPNAGAWFTVAILEGSLIGLLVGQQTFLKERDQRNIAKFAQYIIWGVLTFNTLAAFAVWTSGWQELPSVLAYYTVWGLPLLICGAILLWKELWTRRRAGKKQMLALETNAKVEELWRQQYESNTRAYQQAVKKVSLSREVQQIREALAKQDVIADLAKQHNMAPHELEGLVDARPRELYSHTVDSLPDEPPKYVNGVVNSPKGQSR